MNLAQTIRAAKRVYLVGNGGSYSNAAHIANDLLAVGIRAYTLDAATLTASANDFGYDQVFSRWLRTVGEKGDLLIALSGSGASLNIIMAVREAEKIGMTIWKIYGAPLLKMQEAENEQLRIGHEAMLWLKANA